MKLLAGLCFLGPIFLGACQGKYEPVEIAQWTHNCSAGDVAGPDATLDPNSTTAIIGGQTIRPGGLLARGEVYIERKAGDFDGVYSCTGTLVAPNFILTAAHCASRKKEEAPGPVEIEAIFGADPVCSELNSGSDLNRHSVQVAVFPNYEFGSYDGDVALIRLNAPAPAGTTVMPIARASIDLSKKTSAFVAGFGKLKDRGREETDYTHLHLAEFATRRTDAKVAPTAIYNARHVVVKPTAPVYICDGDSGAGVFTYVDRQLTLIGVVSHGGVDNPVLSCIGAFVFQNVDFYRQELIEMYDKLKVPGDAANPFVVDARAPELDPAAFIPPSEPATSAWWWKSWM